MRTISSPDATSDFAVRGSHNGLHEDAASNDATHTQSFGDSFCGDRELRPCSVLGGSV